MHPVRAQVETEGRSILLADPPLAPVLPKQRMLEVLFEKFRFGTVAIKNAAVLALCSQGAVSLLTTPHTHTRILPYSMLHSRGRVCYANLDACWELVGG